jgi:hypothetical protein
MGKHWTQLSGLEDIFPGLVIGLRAKIYPNKVHGTWDPDDPTEGIIYKYLPDQENAVLIMLDNHSESRYAQVHCHISEVYIYI